MCAMVIETVKDLDTHARINGMRVDIGDVLEIRSFTSTYVGEVVKCEEVGNFHLKYIPDGCGGHERVERLGVFHGNACKRLGNVNTHPELLKRIYWYQETTEDQQ